MTRKEEIRKSAFEYIKSDAVKAGEEYTSFGDFINGAKWADAHPHWISVEDELPKNEELVFITDSECTDLGFYDYTDDLWQPCEKWLGDITHWMPLPQAPKKGGKK